MWSFVEARLKSIRGVDLPVVPWGKKPKEGVWGNLRSWFPQVRWRSHISPKAASVVSVGVFWCEDFKSWCRRKGIRPRFGAVGQHGGIAVVEHFIRTLKEEGTRRILVPHRRADVRKELGSFFESYNG